VGLIALGECVFVVAKRPTDGAQAHVERSIVQARHGSYSALGQLLDHYRDYLLRVANDELESDLNAKIAPSDLVQETFLQAARDFRAFAGKTEGELRAWLRQILIHNLRDASRHFQKVQKRSANEVSLDAAGSESRAGHDIKCPSPAPSEAATIAEDFETLRTALERLPEDYRRVIELRTFEGQSLDEVGRRLNRSSDAARKLWARAIERLAAELAQRKSTPTVARQSHDPARSLG
jgi:RNA polymerase sigma-70 factor (ECF subfamily)